MWSIIMLSWNTLARTAQSISSVRKAVDETGEACEIILVENGSNDGTKEWAAAQDYLIVVDCPENIGVPRARNAGLEVAMGDNILFLDNDIELKPHALPRMSAALEDETVGITGDAGGLFIPEWIENNIWGHDVTDGDYPGCNFVVGYCMALRRDVIDEVGEFDVEFPPVYCEDIDYGIRVRKAGYGIHITSDVCIHLGHSSVSKMMSNSDKDSVEAKGFRRLIEKHGEDCPKWILMHINGTPMCEESLNILKLSMKGMICHVVTTEDIPSDPPNFLVFPSERYPRKTYSDIGRIFGHSTPEFLSDGERVPERDDRISILSSPNTRRPW